MVDFVDGAGYRVDLAYKTSGFSDQEAERNRARLFHAFDRMVAGEEEAFWDLFDPDVTFYEVDCLPYGGAHRGLEATRKAHATIYEYFDMIHIDLEQVLTAGDLGIAYAQMSYRVRRNGRTGRFPLAEVYRFRDGKAIEWRVHYFDANAVAEALASD